MAMNSLKFSLQLYAATLIITLAQLLSPVVCFNHKPPSDNTRGLSFEEKARLGSRPPSCRNKCNQCHPCMAVQIPTLPSHNRFGPGSDRVMPKLYFDSSSLGASNHDSNYKPLLWKCTCGDHFFNP